MAGRMKGAEMRVVKTFPVSRSVPGKAAAMRIRRDWLRRGLLNVTVAELLRPGERGWFEVKARSDASAFAKYLADEARTKADLPF